MTVPLTSAVLTRSWDGPRRALASRGARTTSGASVIATIGIDIGKNTFHVIGLDDKGAIIFRHKLSRGQVYARLANIPPCLIGMEACVGAHHLGRQLSTLGHDTHVCLRWTLIAIA